jgi:nicotinamidase-related amidase
VRSGDGATEAVENPVSSQTGAVDPYTAPDFDSVVLITIDTQRDVLDGAPLEIPGTSAVLPKMRELLDGFRDAMFPIVHVVRLYRPDGSNVDLCRRSAVERGAGLLTPGGSGSQLADELMPTATATLDYELLLAGDLQILGVNEVAIYKPRWGAFFDTPLENHLHKLGVSTVVFSGCNFPNCPRTSIYEASERDFRVVLARDAVSGTYDRGLGELRRIGVGIMTTAEIIERLLLDASARTRSDRA